MAKRVSPHVLRHTTAMDLLQGGVEQRLLALWLGHESVETTQIYLDASLELKQKILDKTRPPSSAPGRYQLLHRTAKVRRGESVLVHGAAGRVGTAVLELGAAAGLRLYGTCSARDRAAVERLGAVAIDYQNEDFLTRVRASTDRGVDVVLDGIGGALSLRSFRALRPGGRLVVFGHYAALSEGHKSWRGWIEWYAATAGVALWSLLSPSRQVLTYRIQKVSEGRQWLPVAARRQALAVGGGPRDPEWFREDFRALLQLLRDGKIRPAVAERMPLAEARHAHELLESSASIGKLVLLP
jgi:NADPH:quinone reductase-like Zn-dependent oxidoreductase